MHADGQSLYGLRAWSVVRLTRLPTQEGPRVTPAQMRRSMGQRRKTRSCDERHQTHGVRRAISATYSTVVWRSTMSYLCAQKASIRSTADHPCFARQNDALGARSPASIVRRLTQPHASLRGRGRRPHEVNARSRRGINSTLDPFTRHQPATIRCRGPKSSNSVAENGLG
jgi:hypothetical protein